MIRKRKALSALIILAVTVLDRLSKQAACRLTGQKIVWPGMLAWHYTENTGIAFSAFDGAGIALILVTAALVIGLFVWLIRQPLCSLWTRIGLTLLIAGGLGNLYDRARWGSVIDFIEVLFVRFAIFNVADIAIVCGTACLLIGILRSEEKHDPIHG